MHKPAAAITPTFLLTTAARSTAKVVERRGTPPLLKVASEKLRMMDVTFRFVLGGLTPS